MIILSWNCGNGLRSKLDAVRYIIEKSNPDAFFIHEAEITQNHLAYYSIKNYELVTSNSISGPSGKARTICYIKLHTSIKVVQIKDDLVDLVIIEVDNIAIAGLYRGFKTPSNLLPNQFFERYLSSLNIITGHKKYKDIFIIGDFNIDPIRDSGKWNGKMLEKWSSENFLTQHIKGITRQRTVLNASGQYSTQKSLIDLAFSRNILPTVKYRKNTDYGSDHICLEINIKLELTSQTRKIFIRDTTKLSEINILKEAFKNTTTISTLEELGELHYNILEKLAPTRTIRIRTPNNIINPRVEKVKKLRDRLYKEYKKSGNHETLAQAKLQTKRLKKVIKREAYIKLSKKAQTPNSECFWKVVNELQGKNCKNEIKSIIDENEKVIDDDTEIANTLASFFKNKVENLRTGHTPLENTDRLMTNLRNDSNYDFTEEEIAAAIQNTKPKMSSGPDGIPTKIVKYSYPALALIYRDLFNRFLKNGIPKEWRLARVIALQKKGNSTKVSNFRPISNLCSLEKIFEKCILARLTQLNMDTLVGTHQHGFRQKHSTTTCLLDLQNYVTDQLDKKMNVLCYTVDLSAAFDMLRKDIFLKLHHKKIPDYLLWSLGDFLTDRSFYVEHNGKTSSIENLSVGCVQGSVLGPVLFNMYLHDIQTVLGDAAIFTYADDSYVCISNTDIPQAISTTESIISEHISFLQNRGMVVNKSKTEAILFSNAKTIPQLAIKIDGDTIKTRQSIKALGVHIDEKLSWDVQIHSLAQRLKGLTSGLWIIANKLSREMILRILTAQVFSILYYGCPVWLTPSLSRHNFKRIERMHYTALRVAIKDRRKRVNREKIDSITKRMPPHSWMKYSSTSTFIKINRDEMPTRLRQNLSKNTFQERRKPGRLYSRDTSTCKNGQKSMKNWIGTFLRQLNFDWINTGRHITDDYLRVHLKKCFYTSRLL